MATKSRRTVTTASLQEQLEVLQVQVAAVEQAVVSVMEGVFEHIEINRSKVLDLEMRLNKMTGGVNRSLRAIMEHVGVETVAGGEEHAKIRQPKYEISRTLVERNDNDSRKQ